MQQNFVKFEETELCGGGIHVFFAISSSVTTLIFIVNISVAILKLNAPLPNSALSHYKVVDDFQFVCCF